MQIIRAFITPLLFLIYIPNLTAFSSRFLIQTIVDDKQNKMRETLRLMSLTQFSYGLSYVLFQGIIAVLGSIIMGLFLFNNKDTFPDHPFGYSIAFIIVLVVLYVAMIPFAMSISTPFTDSKVANYAGNLILTFPILIFIQLTQTTGAMKNLIYLFFFMPIFPAMTILVKITES